MPDHPTGRLPFILIAHRGFSSNAPENTLAAFDMALTAGFGHIELDVQLTADGVPVVIHDRTLERTTDGTGEVARATAEETAQLDAGSWFEGATERGYIGLEVPRLEKILERYAGKVHLYIELKSDQAKLPSKVERLLRSLGWMDTVANEPDEVPGVTLLSFHPSQLRRCRKLMPKVRRGLLLKRRARRDLGPKGDLELYGIYPHVRRLNAGFVSEAHSEGLAVGAWGVETLPDLARAVDLGAYGATVDWPTKARDYLQRMSGH